METGPYAQGHDRASRDGNSFDLDVNLTEGKYVSRPLGTRVKPHKFHP